MFLQRCKVLRRGSWLIGLIVCLPVLIVPAYGLDLHDKIDPLARSMIDNHVAVGCVVGIVKNGETQVLGYGEVVKGEGKLPDRDTVYEIGSITKVFTCVLLADMVERGMVKLDDPVQNYLPASVTMPIFDDKPITLEHLATHTSGLPRMPSNFTPDDPKNPYADYHLQQMYEFLQQHKLRRPPGKNEYSNLGMGLLGELLAARAEMPYAALLADRITRPLGMNDTQIQLDERLRSRLASPYNGDLQPEKSWNLDAFAGAGGIRSTASDMLKFVQANLALDDQPLGRALRLAQQKRLDIDHGLAMALGWHIARDGITRWHNGMTGGYHAAMYVVPSLNVGVVVLANTSTMKVSEYAELMTQAALGMNVKPPVARKEIKVDAATLEKYVGKYEMTPQFILTVTLEEGQLMVGATGQPKFPVHAESPTEFYYKVVDAQITFVVDKDGNVSKLVLHQGGQDLDARRLADAKE